MERIQVGVVGASGYSGSLAARLVAAHPHMRLAFATSDARAGEPVARAGVASDLAFCPNAEARARASDCDAVILATSAEVSARLVPDVMAAARLVVDLSGAFRLRAPTDTLRWYGFEPSVPIESVHYGLPELFGAPPQSGLVANPGCYPTASLLALGPLLRAGLVLAGGMIIDAKSGVTGAGRQSKEAYSFSEVDENVRAYKLLSHQHQPEIAQKLAAIAPSAAAVADVETTLTFTAHLLPVRRGILATCYARPASAGAAGRFEECLRDAYAKSPFVRVVAADEVSLASVVGTNEAHVGVAARDDVVIVVSSIDNLIKGASGQAVQNLNLAFGFDEAAGLRGLQRSAA